MWWLERDPMRSFACRLACIVTLGGLVAGCFQPLYGEHSFTNSPNISSALAGVDVSQISAPSGSPEARIAVETRNQLLFDLTGVAAAAPPTHRLVIRMSSTRLSVIVDIKRFARARGLRDAEDRAAKVIADNIRSRIASYFVAGT